MRALHPPPSYPRRRVSSTPRVSGSITDALGYWVPACVGTTIERNFAFSRHTVPEFCKFVRPKKQRAQGRPGARCTRGLACKGSKQKRTRAYRFSGSSPAFPAQWFYGLSSCSPRRDQSLLVTVAPRKRELPKNLTPAIGASGPHDFAVRLSRARQSQHQRPSLPDPRFVTNAHTPL
jgi:hypothetical protein